MALMEFLHQHILAQNNDKGTYNVIAPNYLYIICAYIIQISPI